MSNLVPIEKMPIAPEPVDPSTTLLQVIANAAANPACDVDKMLQLLAMKERLDAKGAEREFDAAMSEAQAEMRGVATDKKNASTRSEYASYFTLDKAVRPIYTKHGFSLSFNTGSAGTDTVNVLCRVSHKAGYSREYSIIMPADGKGAKGGDVMTKTHATGSAATYGMRYLLKMIFNIAIGADPDDDDGNRAEGLKSITTEQIMEIDALLTKNHANKGKFLTYMGVSDYDMIAAKDFTKAVRVIEDAARAAKEKAAKP